VVEGPARDNARLSGPTIDGPETTSEVVVSALEPSWSVPAYAVDCIADAASKVEAYVQAGIAPATRRA
jgi:hypothetical protein